MSSVADGDTSAACSLFTEPAERQPAAAFDAPDCAAAVLASGSPYARSATGTANPTTTSRSAPSIAPKILMPLVWRSRVGETGGASTADVVSAWRGLSPFQRLTLEPAPVGYSGLPPFRARVSDS